MAKKSESLAAKHKPTAADLAIAEFRAAHVEWDRAMPRCQWAVITEDVHGNRFTTEYWVPGGEAWNAWGKTGDDCVALGLSTPAGESSARPVLRPTNVEWQAAYDACAAARIMLASAADKLAAAISGTGNAARVLRNNAKRLAGHLRDVPPVWPTSVEKELAFGINNGDIVDFHVELREARRRQRDEEARATEERRKQKEERAFDALLAWREAQRETPAEERPTKRQRQKSENVARLRDLLKQPKWRDAKHSSIATELGVAERTLRTYLQEMRAE